LLTVRRLLRLACVVVVVGHDVCTVWQCDVESHKGSDVDEEGRRRVRETTDRRLNTLPRSSGRPQ
jgi:hypothetical protein